MLLTGIDDSKIIQNIEHDKKMTGFDINSIYGQFGWSSLMIAVYYDRKELARYLLSDPSINVYHRTNRGETALHFCHQISILKLLLDIRVFDVNIQNNLGDTGLHRFCRFEHKELARELLLDTRVNVHIRNNYGKIALDYALEQGCLDIAKIIENSRHTTLLRIPNRALLHDIVRMIIEEYT